MKLTLLFVIVLFCHVSAKTYGQNITLNEKNTSLKNVIHAIEKQSRFHFLYDDLALFNVKRVNIRLTNVSIEKALEACFKNEPVSYKVFNDVIVLKTRVPAANAQADTLIKGKILDEKGISIPGASVMIKGTQNGTTTDTEGRFSLTVPINATLSISYIGYLQKEVQVTAARSYILSLQPNNQNLTEVVVVGYGTQSKAKVLGATAQLKSESIKDMPISSIEQGLAGQVAGVQVSQTSGAPGGGISVRVRGLGSITAGNQPLYVIDGFPVNNPNTNMLNPSDIETVDVLKDAAATAIYGSRGSNGVVILSTKKGNTAKPVFNFDAYFGQQKVAKTIDMMDAYQYANFVASSRNNWWLNQNPANSVNDPNSVRPNVAQIPDFIQPYLQGKTGLANTNWQDEIFRNAPVQNYSLSAAGGKEGLRYYVSGNYFDQDGVIIHSDFKRYSARANIESKLSDRVTLGFNLSPSYANQKNVSEGGHGADGAVITSLIAMPTFPARNADGSYAIGNQAREAVKYSMAVLENPVATANLIDNTTSKLRLLGGTYLDVKIIDGLKFKTFFGTDYYNASQNYFRPSVLGIYRVPPPSQATGSAYRYHSLNWVSENTLNYNKSFGKHNLTVLAGYTAQKEKTQADSITGTGFPNDQVHTLSGATKITAGTSVIENWSLLSYLGRVNYDYENRYLFSASIRRDGSSRFGPNNKWGWFPSASAGWRISKEGFFPENTAIDELKLRASYGKTGNFQIPNYGAYSLLNNANYVLNGRVINGQVPGTAPNDNLSWEKTDQVNAGLDLGLFHSKLYLTFDYYTSTTKDMLLNVPVPYASGFSTMLRNVGEVKNQGFDLSLSSSRIKLGPVEYTGSFNISSNKNKVVSLGPGQSQIIVGRNITKVGQPIGSFYGYNVLGVFKDQNELNTYPHLPTSLPGSYKYEDINGDKQITSADRKTLGNPFPKYIAGLSSNFKYKNVDLSFLIQAVEGFEVANVLKAVYLINGEGWGNASVDEYNGRYISPANPGNGYAKNLVQPTDNNHQTSSYMIEDASFIRMRNITLGYSLPKSLGKKLNVQNLRLYLSAQNPFTITKYSGYNPEVSQNGANALEPGIDFGAYPASKSIILGLNASF